MKQEPVTIAYEIDVVSGATSNTNFAFPRAGTVTAIELTCSAYYTGATYGEGRALIAKVSSAPNLSDGRDRNNVLTGSTFKLAPNTNVFTSKVIYMNRKVSSGEVWSMYEYISTDGRLAVQMIVTLE